MTQEDILQYRLYNQHLSQKDFKTPHEAVSWLGAVQSQDYTGAKWGVAQRINNATDEMMDHAFNEGKILRTHVMRPTWHFVAPEDIRWMLKLTKNRVKSLMGSYNKKLDLDNSLFAKSASIFTQALQGKKNLTRQELKIHLTQAGINTDVQRLAHIVMWAELDGIICSGPLKGKQFSYMLLEERVSKTKTLTREEALEELTRRYFNSHGPAQLKDFMWWSGLTVADAKTGVEMNKINLQEKIIDGKTYWLSSQAKPIKQTSSKIYLLPNYDEYGIAYADRSALVDEKHTFKLDPRGNNIFAHLIILDGKHVGNWKRIIKKNEVIIEADFKPFHQKEREALETAAQEYGKFLNLPVVTNLF